MTNGDANDVQQTVQECCTEVPNDGPSCCRADLSSSCCAGPEVAVEQIQEERAIRTVDELHPDEVREAVRERYAEISKGDASCASASTSPCACQPAASADEISASLGYSSQELESAPDGANLGLGCGNPQAVAALKSGETVLDLGSGGGFDCFLAARQVGGSGRVIGVDMTPEMVSKARANGVAGRYENVEFRLGEIEHLPVADNSVDVILSNCVINLSPDKPQVFADAFRVLRPGGRLAISDVVAVKPLPPKVKSNLDAHCGCVAGAALVADLEQTLRDVGFTDISIRLNEESREFIKTWFPGSGAEEFAVSADIEARKGVSGTSPWPAPACRAGTASPKRGKTCCS